MHGYSQADNKAAHDAMLLQSLKLMQLASTRSSFWIQEFFVKCPRTEEYWTAGLHTLCKMQDDAAMQQDHKHTYLVEPVP